MHTMRTAQPIWICGPGRSGTTYLFNLLSSHPEIYGIKRDGSGGGPDNGIETGIWINRKDHLRESMLDQYQFEERFYVEKTSDHNFYYDKIVNYFPASKFVFTLRHPICIVESILRTHRKYYPTVDIAVEYTCKSVRQMLSNYTKGDGIVVVHELWALDAIVQLDRVLRFIGVDNLSMGVILKMFELHLVKMRNDNAAAALRRLSTEDCSAIMRDIPALLCEIEPVFHYEMEE